jgi:hypothetical protein
MGRLSPLLFVLVLTSSLAQSIDSSPAKQAPYPLITLVKYCANVEALSDFQQPRMFAQVFFGRQTSDWVEFESKAAWKQAGKPQPLALVWYKDSKAVRVVLTAESGDNGQSYADYCYRPDGSLAELRPVPAVNTKCAQSLFNCAVTFRGPTRFYLPKEMLAEAPLLPLGVGALGAGPVIVTESRGQESSFVAQTNDFGLYDVLVGLKPEKTTVSFAADWPEYLNVSDLPFNRLLYVFPQ